MSVASAFNLDFSILLAPISQEFPAGESLRYEGTYDRIMEARREEDANLAQGVWQRELKKADWNQVHQICLEALQRRSKDLQIAAWMLEALIHLRGFGGARAGCEAMVELGRTFWDTMYRAGPSCENKSLNAPLDGEGNTRSRYDIQSGADLGSVPLESQIVKISKTASPQFAEKLFLGNIEMLFDLTQSGKTPAPFHKLA